MQINRCTVYINKIVDTDYHEYIVHFFSCTYYIVHFFSSTYYIWISLEVFFYVTRYMSLHCVGAMNFCPRLCIGLWLRLSPITQPIPKSKSFTMLCLPKTLQQLTQRDDPFWEAVEREDKKASFVQEDANLWCQ